MPRKICCLGDSITWTATTRSIHPYPLYLEMLLGAGYIVGNQAVSGYTISQIQTLYTSYVQGKGYADVILLGGINDIKGGTLGSTVWTTYKAIVDACIADGCRVIGLNTLQFNNYNLEWNSDDEGERVILNNSIASYLTSKANCTFIDAAAQFRSVADASIMHASYDIGDHLHPNQAGTYLLAQLARTAILATG